MYVYTKSVIAFGINLCTIMKKNKSKIKLLKKK